MSRALGIDIGGTKIAAGLVASNGSVSRRVEVATPAQEGPDAIIAAVLAAASSAMDGEAVVACGVGTAGVVGRSGEISSATDLLRGWAGTPLAERLAQGLGLSVSVLNDVHAAALCEARLGAARSYSSALVIAVGTGVGGAYVLDGIVQQGEHGIAGSIGHMPCTLREGRRCSCGAIDHVEGHASGAALEAKYLERTGRQRPLRAIAQLAADGDALSRQLIEEAATALGAAIAGANNIVDAAVVVVGGGVMSLGGLLFDPLRAAAGEQALGRSKTVPIVSASFGPDACLVGAGLAGLQMQLPVAS